MSVRAGIVVIPLLLCLSCSSGGMRARSSAARQPEPPFSRLEILSNNTPSGMVFADYGTNPTIETKASPISTVAIDPDIVSFLLVRRYLTAGRLPPAEAIRVEDLLNAPSYDYEAATTAPFSIDTELFPSPFREGYQVLRIGLRGREAKKRDPIALVFLVNRAAPLEQIKRSIQNVIGQLQPQDSVSIVAYGEQADLSTLDDLSSARFGDLVRGLEAARRLSGTRMVLYTNGTDRYDKSVLQRTVESLVEEGISVSTVGVGNSYDDGLLERIARAGNGAYFHDDGSTLAAQQLASLTKAIVAEDLRMQVEFDPSAVERYRLLGYENRALESHQLDSARTRGGFIGAGQRITVLYEIALSDLKRDFGRLRVRYGAELVERDLTPKTIKPTFARAAPSARLAFVMSVFAEKLRSSYWVRHVSYADLLGLHSQIEVSRDVKELGALIRSAQQLGDQVLPKPASFDRVPVLR